MPDVFEAAIAADVENLAACAGQELGGVTHAHFVDPVGGRFAEMPPYFPRHVGRAAPRNACEGLPAGLRAKKLFPLDLLRRFPQP